MEGGKQGPGRDDEYKLLLSQPREGRREYVCGARTVWHQGRDDEKLRKRQLGGSPALAVIKRDPIQLLRPPLSLPALIRGAATEG